MARAGRTRDDASDPLLSIRVSRDDTSVAVEPALARFKQAWGGRFLGPDVEAEFNAGFFRARVRRSARGPTASGWSLWG